MTTLTQEPSNPYAPPQAEVSDDGNANIDSVPHLASRGSRLGAWFLDALIGSTLGVAPLLIGTDFGALMRAATADDLDGMLGAMSSSAIVGFLLGLAIWLGLTLYFVAKNSQTVGKKIVGIKVARSDGSRASLGRIFWLRNMVNALPSAIPFIGNFYSLVDHLCIFGSTNKCLHDRIADTIVVDA